MPRVRRACTHPRRRLWWRTLIGDIRAPGRRGRSRTRARSGPGTGCTWGASTSSSQAAPTTSARVRLQRGRGAALTSTWKFYLRRNYFFFSIRKHNCATTRPQSRRRRASRSWHWLQCCDIGAERNHTGQTVLLHSEGAANVALLERAAGQDSRALANHRVLNAVTTVQLTVVMGDTHLYDAVVAQHHAVQDHRVEYLHLRNEREKYEPCTPP